MPHAFTLDESIALTRYTRVLDAWLRGLPSA